MAFTWSNIQNNEGAGSVRGKLNALGTDYATTSTSQQTSIDGLSSSVNTINEQLTTINGSLQTLNSMLSISNNVSCPVAQWEEDVAQTYEGFIYKADLYITGVTSDMVPFVNFAASEQESGNFIGATSGTNIVTIWASDKPSADFTIPNIVLLQSVSV